MKLEAGQNSRDGFQVPSENPGQNDAISRPSGLRTGGDSHLSRSSRLAMATVFGSLVALAGCGGEVDAGQGTVDSAAFDNSGPEKSNSSWIAGGVFELQGSYAGGVFKLKGSYPGHDSFMAWGTPFPDGGTDAYVLAPFNVTVAQDGTFTTPQGLPSVNSSLYLHAGLDLNGNGSVDPDEEQPITNEESVLESNPNALKGSSFVPGPHIVAEQADSSGAE